MPCSLERYLSSIFLEFGINAKINTERHVNPAKVPKIRVKYAAEVFSNSIANFLRFLSTSTGSFTTANGPITMPAETIATTQVLKFFNDLFNFVNGDSRKPKNDLRRDITPDSRHHTFWSEAIKTLQQMEFVNIGTETKATGVKSIRNWIKTIQSMEALSQKMYGMGFASVSGDRAINQDFVENYFGQNRCLRGRDVKPSTTTFESNFKTLLINNFCSIRTIGGYCEADNIQNLIVSNKTLLDPSTHDETLSKHINLPLDLLLKKEVEDMSQKIKKMQNSKLSANY